MESLALTVEEVVDVRRVLVKAEMEKFVQDKELFSSLKRGKVRLLDRVGLGVLPGPAALEAMSRLHSSQVFSSRFAAAAGPGSHCSPGHPPVSSARGEPHKGTVATSEQG